MPPLPSGDARAVDAAADILRSMRLLPTWSPGIGAYHITCNFCGESGGHWSDCGVPAAGAWLDRYDLDRDDPVLLHTVRPLMAWLAGHGTEDYPGDGYGVTCRVCGRETDGRDIKAAAGEGHELSCPIPEIRGWVGVYGK